MEKDTIPRKPGTYVLVIEVQRYREVHVGKLGECQFRRGHYLYVGSALGGLRARLGRHLRAEKRLHWHIDYLLAAADIVEVWYRCSQEHRECVWAAALGELALVSPFDASFGASDCACKTHLFYAARCPSPDELADRLGEPLVVHSAGPLCSEGFP